MLNVYIALDRSGSMVSNWTETLGSLNGYVDTLKGAEPTQVTVVALDSINPYEVLRSKEDVETFLPITRDEVMPRGLTPLWDTAGRMIAEAFADDLERTVLVYITDGYENGSREFTRETVKAAVAQCEARNWQTVFLGANFDASAYTDALGLSGSSARTMSGSAGYAKGFADLSMATMAYRSAGAAIDLTENNND